MRMSGPEVECYDVVICLGVRVARGRLVMLNLDYQLGWNENHPGTTPLDMSL